MSDSPFFPAALRQAIDGAISRIVQDIVAPQPLPEQERQLALDQFVVVRQRTLDLITPLTQPQASFQPASGSWSVAEILDHLLLTEKVYRTQLQRLVDLARGGKATSVQLSLKEMNASIAPIPRDIMPYFEKPLLLMNSLVPHSLRETMFRFPLIAGVNPAASDPLRKDIALLRTELESSLAASKALFEGEMPARLNEMTLTHPMLGSNNVVTLFRLLSAHEERHHGQTRKVLAHPNCPKA